MEGLASELGAHRALAVWSRGWRAGGKSVCGEFPGNPMGFISGDAILCRWAFACAYPSTRSPPRFVCLADFSSAFMIQCKGHLHRDPSVVASKQGSKVRPHLPSGGAFCDLTPSLRRLIECVRSSVCCVSPDAESRKVMQLPPCSRGTPAQAPKTPRDPDEGHDDPETTRLPRPPGYRATRRQSGRRPRLSLPSPDP